MKRLVWGIVLIVLGFLSFTAVAMRTAKDPVASALGGLLCLGGGATLAYFGERYRKRKRAVVELSFQMLRQSDRIDAAELSKRLQLGEMEVRQYINEAQRSGTLPFKAEIV